MTRIPDKIEGLGRSDERWRQNPAFDVGSYAFDTDSYFIWSRIDGHATLRDIMLMVGLPTERTVAVLAQLRAAGAALRPGENPRSVTPSRPNEDRPVVHEPAASVKTAEASKAQPNAQPDAAPSEPEWTEEEATAMALQLDLSDQVKRRVVSMRRLVATADYFALFEVERDSLDKKTLKRSYFRLSKEFHPDRYYSKQTGPFGPWLAEIFQAVTEGFQVLSDNRSRERYLQSLDASTQLAATTQTREEYAAELFERAKGAEIAGQLPRALELFAAATRLVSDVRYLVRAAHCALAARDVDGAREYARRAREREPNNPSVLRLLAESHHRAGEFDEAERILLEALDKKTENDKLVAELRRDLDAVRAKRGS